MTEDEVRSLNAAIRTIGMRHRALASAALARIGLAVGQETVIMELARRGPRSQAQLAVAAGCEPPTMTAAVRRMEANGIIRREPSAEDRRAVVVNLTDQGRGVAEQLSSVWRDIAEETTAGLARTEVSDLIDALGDLAQSLKGRSVPVE
ncbi:DNA-binding MarR family transcriptional regulator [Arthrobacter pigmenti]|uniref:DNA-binding MarR family transcriptional regulator n=1 Tax=Arthrobacter pigmenti TaxID=271432 RepID=A0A846S0P6_9MICC|nr:MarR family winged helix-turn-helix transcriptional regulator [Arthrobacter pigmenti]NJC24011.1 DNA-binding MarR family transcriptional regulator [Arthrobacter pigmenti]